HRVFPKLAASCETDVQIPQLPIILTFLYNADITDTPLKAKENKMLVADGLGNSRISKRSFGEGPILMLYPEARGLAPDQQLIVMNISSRKQREQEIGQAIHPQDLPM
ncbi:hypothetical protein STEG23_034965, partial [Scotinomys teguina]